MTATHLVFATTDRSPLPSDRLRVRTLVAAILRVCQGVPVLAFHISDSHVHLVVMVDRAAAGRLAQRLALTLRSVVGTVLSPANFTPILDQKHLVNTFEYVLRNDEKHGVSPDPWRENSALPDLLGLRVVPTNVITTVRRALPRMSGASLRAMAGWPELTPLSRLHGAAAAAAGALALPALRGRSASDVDALRAITHLVPDVKNSAFQAELGRSRQALRILRGQPARPELVRAIGLQLAMREAVPLGDGEPFSASGEPRRWGSLYHRAVV